MPDRLIVSLDLALPVAPDADPVEYSTMMTQVTYHLLTVFGIEIKHTAGTVAESVYDEPADGGPDDGGEAIGFVTMPANLPPVIEDVDLYAIIGEVTKDEQLTAAIYANMLAHGYGGGHA